ncbi:Crp/Fnr family transcriptional regulator [Sphingomonas flavalba]|uniref:Crp/Fnr family transcriptional regulator n=1 Tax=Sphingomonas flavalba TaxID=2559804 RepID=UPI00109DB185|nr:Crp/Fnr family transcriptional regulator [Sphingomonas flavalba]
MVYVEPHLDERCAACLVRDQALCASLADDELSALSAIGRTRPLARGQTLIWAGDSSSVCANLVSGVLKMATATADGREQIVGLLFPGDFVGQPFAEEASLTFAALTDASLCVYPREGFVEVLADHPALERLLLQRTMAALDDARSRMLTLGRRSASEKVAGFLLELGHRLPRRPGSGPAAGYVFDLPLGRAQIADVLGLTIETVSRQLTRLRTSGVIALSGRRTVAIREPARLKRLASTAGA